MIKEGYYSVQGWFGMIIMYLLLKLYLITSAGIMLYMYDTGRVGYDVYMTLLNFANDYIVALVLILAFAAEVVFNFIRRYWRDKKTPLVNEGVVSEEASNG